MTFVDSHHDLKILCLTISINERAMLVANVDSTSSPSVLAGSSNRNLTF